MAAVAKRRKSDLDQPLPHYAIASPSLLADIPANVNEAPPTKQQEKEWGTIYDHCEQSWTSLYTWRNSYWATCCQISRYIAPWRYYTFVTPNTYNENQRRDYAIVDNTATLAGEKCGAGIMAGLFDPDREWIKLGPAIPGFEPDKQGQMFYEDLTERYNYVLDHCNFYETQAQLMNDLTFFGNAPVIDYESEENIIQCFLVGAGEYCLAVGMNNTDEVMAREFRQTVRQTVEMFGPENCPQDILELWKGNGADNEHVIRHLIEPNSPIVDRVGVGVGKVPGDFTWREVYWMAGKQNRRPLSMTGFRENPFAVYRWDAQGNSPYARGIGEKMLADTVQLQFETRQKEETIEKSNRPPMGADVSLQNMPAAITPAKITYMNVGNGGEKKFWPLFQVDPKAVEYVASDIEIIQQRIMRTAHNDAFQPLTDLRERMKEQMTTVEVDMLKEESLIPLGPMIGRAYGATRQRVKRHLHIMARRGLLPRKPPSLRGVPLKIDFVSMLTEARRATATAAITRTAQFTGSLVEAWPEARFTLDPEAMVREFNEGVGATTKILRSPQEIKRMIQNEAQQKAIANVSAITQQGAAAAKDLSTVGPNTALSNLVGPRQ